MEYLGCGLQKNCQFFDERYIKATKVHGVALYFRAIFGCTQFLFANPSESLRLPAALCCCLPVLAVSSDSVLLPAVSYHYPSFHAAPCCFLMLTVVPCCSMLFPAAPYQMGLSHFCIMSFPIAVLLFPVLSVSPAPCCLPVVSLQSPWWHPFFILLSLCPALLSPYAAKTERQRCDTNLTDFIKQTGGRQSTWTSREPLNLRSPSPTLS